MSGTDVHERWWPVRVGFGRDGDDEAGVCGRRRGRGAVAATYDGDLTGTAVPSKGSTTRTSIDTGVVGTAAPSYSLNTTTAYDSWGRVTSVSEPATGATTVAYTPAASTTPQLMTSMVTTNSKGHAVTVTY